VGGRQLAVLLGAVVALAAAVATIWALVDLVDGAHSVQSTAVADPCPDIEVVFARGTGEPAGVGGVGQPFVDSLRSQVGGRSVNVYAVNYPASDDYINSVYAGAQDASGHVGYMAANCPNTRIVLGGYSQGAAVIDLITAAPISAWGANVPMPPEVAGHVAAVAVMGNPSRNLPGGGPLTAISPLYGAKAIDLCFPFDPVCTQGFIPQLHYLYVQSGLVAQAATFAASRV
jgi:cutinase